MIVVEILHLSFISESVTERSLLVSFQIDAEDRRFENGPKFHFSRVILSNISEFVRKAPPLIFLTFHSRASTIPFHFISRFPSFKFKAADHPFLLILGQITNHPTADFRTQLDSGECPSLLNSRKLDPNRSSVERGIVASRVTHRSIWQ
jgi:hypothetical protein